jgi:hypothetical protein
MFNYPTAKTRTLYTSTDGPADNRSNPDGLRAVDRNVPEMTVWYVDSSDRQFANASVLTRTQTRNYSPEPLLTLAGIIDPCHFCMSLYVILLCQLLRVFP